MSKKYKVPDYIRIVKAICIEYGNIHNTWTWCYAMDDIKKAMKKVKKIVRTLKPDDRFRIGLMYCGQDRKTGKVYELVPSEDNFTINGIEYGEFETVLFDSTIASWEDWPDGTPEHIFGKL